MVRSKSQAQAELYMLVRDAFPTASVRQEVQIGRLIDAAGYSPQEIAEELGHKPHRMSVDIYATTSEFACAFEYQGEQHYRSAGNMNATGNALKWDQDLDEEKGWILRRVGTPIVYVPYDAYVDKPVLEHMVAEAMDEVAEASGELYVCESCGRRFPSRLLVAGECARCRSRLASAGDREQEYDRYGIPIGMYGSEDDDAAELPSMFTPEGKAARKAADKARRKAERERYKASPEYQAQKELMRRMRKDRYREQKERMRQERAASGGRKPRD